MTFKTNWEKASTRHQLPYGMIERMAMLAYPHKKIISHELIPGGCANLNYKIQVENQLPVILRIYLRDPESRFREQKAGQIFKGKIPVPQIYYIGEIDEHHFAIMEFLPGITLRDLLMSNPPLSIIKNVMDKVGTLLAVISNQTRKEPVSNFSIENEAMTQGYIKCIQEYLTIIGNKLSLETIDYIEKVFIQNSDQLPNDYHIMCHGDFNPANILVDQQGGEWKITGILDWEFFFPGSVLWDVANMLRYAHEMPPEFQNSFLEGLKAGGIPSSENWQISIHLLNLLSLLDLLVRCNTQIQPNQYRDILGLIEHILKEIH